MVVYLGTTPLITQYGEFEFSGWYDGHSEAYSIHCGAVQGANDVPVRVHSSCVTAHYFNATECDCREQLAIAQEKIAAAGKGILIVLDQQAKANGILATLNYKRATTTDTYSVVGYRALGYPDDARDYRTAAHIIRQLGPATINLLSNSPDKESQLRKHGVVIAAVDGIRVDLAERPDLKQHYDAKRDIEGHRV